MLDDAFKKARKSRIYDERGLTLFRERLEKYYVRIRKIVNGAVAFSHLFDSLIEYVNKNLEDSFTDSSKEENIDFLMFGSVAHTNRLMRVGDSLKGMILI